VATLAAAVAARPALDFALSIQDAPGLRLITFHTDQGRVRVYLPDRIVAGAPFSGTVEAVAEGASSDTADYQVEIDGSVVTPAMRHFHVTPPTTTGRIPLILRSPRSGELGRTDVATTTAEPESDSPGSELRLPPIVESTAPIPILGALDGDSTHTRFELNGQSCDILTEVADRAMAMCGRTGPATPPVGRLPYRIESGTATAHGTVRAVAVRLDDVPLQLENAVRGKIRLSVDGLRGLEEELELRIEVQTPTLVILDSHPPADYFPHRREDLFLQPLDFVKTDRLRVDRMLSGIQNGGRADPIVVTARLVIPTTARELVEHVLRAPRVNMSRAPGEEAAAKLAPLGDRGLALVAGFLRDPQLAFAATEVLLLDETRAAPFMLPALPGMGGQPLETALAAYRRLATQEPGFPFRRELHDAARRVLEAGGASREALFTLGVVGTAADEDLLVGVSRAQEAASPTLASPLLHAAVAALARLGSTAHIERIKSGLRTTVKTPADAMFFERFADDAAFTERTEFVPLLCGHLSDPSWWWGDYGDAPASSAEAAIRAILHIPVTSTNLTQVCGKANDRDQR